LSEPGLDRFNGLKRFMKAGKSSGLRSVGREEIRVIRLIRVILVQTDREPNLSLALP
jgi:hypothetical protein